MAGEISEETFVEQKVTYTLEIEGRFVIVEHVPARVSVKTGERYVSPETVERLQHVVWEGKSPSRVVETPVFEYPDVRA
jgi:hypothetical protein